MYKYMTDFEDLVGKLKMVDRINSCKDVGLAFLSKVPKVHAPVVRYAEDQEDAYVEALLLWMSNYISQ